MWFFNYFATSYTLTSGFAFIYDVCTNSYKHFARSRKEVVDASLKMLPVVSFNLFGVTLPYSLFVEYCIKDVERNNYGVIVNSLITYFIADFLTYFMHRLFHNPKLYWIHKMHHEFVYPLSIGAIYAHPLDYFFVNLFPFTFSIFVMYPPDWFIKGVIVFVIFVTTIQSHGSYTLFDDSHLKHHKFYKVNYGLGLMDRIMGTSA